MDFATITDLSLDKPWPWNTTQYIANNFKILFENSRFVKFNGVEIFSPIQLTSTPSPGPV